MMCKALYILKQIKIDTRLQVPVIPMSCYSIVIKCSDLQYKGQH